MTKATAADYPQSEGMPASTPSQKILIISWSHIGDTILSTAAVQMIRKAYPRAFISLLTSPLCKPLLDSRKLADECIAIPVVRGFRKHIAEVINILRFRAYDHCFFFGHPEAKILRTCQRAGIAVRVAPSSELDNRHNTAAKYATHVIETGGPLSTQRHISQYYIEIVRGYIPDAPRQEIYICAPEKGNGKAAELGREAGARKKIAFCFYGSKINMTRWPEERFVSLMRKFDPASYYLYTVVPGPDLSRAEEMAERNKLPLHCLETPTLEDCAALLQEADLLLGIDTGQSHIAAALGVPVITLAGKTAAFSHPCSDKGIALSSVKSCLSCPHAGACPVNAQEKVPDTFVPKCMLALTPDIVYEYAMLYIQGNYLNKPYIVIPGE